MLLCMQVIACIMPRKPERHKEDHPTRDRILDAALLEFGAKGFKGATTKAIAKRASVNEVTIFRHFESKLGLFEAVFEERSLLSQVMENVSFDFDGDMEEVLYRNMRFVLGTLRQNRHMFMMLLGDASRMPELRGLISDLVVRKAPEFVAPNFQRMMAEGQMRRMDPVVAVRAMMGMVQAYFIMDDLLGSGDIDEEKDERMLRGFVSIFLDGVREGD